MFEPDIGNLDRIENYRFPGRFIQHGFHTEIQEIHTNLELSADPVDSLTRIPGETEVGWTENVQFCGILYDKIPTESMLEIMTKMIRVSYFSMNFAANLFLDFRAIVFR